MKSLSNYLADTPSTSLSNAAEELRVPAPLHVVTGLNDENRLREILIDSIRSCGKSRDQIADEMSFLLQTRVTRRALDLYTAESAEQNRFPMQYARAFCKATGSTTLLSVLAELAGMKVIGRRRPGPA